MPRPLPPIRLLGLGLAPGDGRLPLEPAALDGVDVIIGGKAVLASLADHPAEKLAAGADIEALYARIEALRRQGKRLLALCWGDPLFFGLGARLAERFGPEAVEIMPGVSSLQAAAAFLGLPWEGMRAVSLHGRGDMFPLAHALAEGGPVCVLCDAQVDPLQVAAWLEERGHGGCRLHVLDNLHADAQGWPQAEAHAVFRADQGPAAGLPPATNRRLLVLEPDEASAPTAFGLDDSALEREGNLITKRPARAAALACLGILPGDTVWDIGAGSGAVSIDASRLAWRGRVFAVEPKPARAAAIRVNRKRCRACTVEIVEGLFPDCLAAASLPRPQRIFLGGGLGGASEKAEALLRSAWDQLLPGGRLAAHCVLLASLERARAVLGALAGEVAVSVVTAAESTPLAGDLRLQALNPVFLVTARK